MSTTEEHRTPVSLSSVTADSPHMQPAARNPERVERWTAVLLLLGLLGFIGFGWAYWVDATPWILGATMGAGFSFVGIAVVAWGKYLMPKGPFVEERHDLRSSDAEREAFAAAITQRGGLGRGFGSGLGCRWRGAYRCTGGRQFRGIGHGGGGGYGSGPGLP